MTRVIIYKNAEGGYRGISVSGHSGYAAAGEDIVCASVSFLTINTINSIDRLTCDRIRVTENDKKLGLISCEISGETASALSSETQILLKAYEMGVLELSRRYNEVGLVIKQDEVSV